MEQKEKRGSILDRFINRDIKNELSDTRLALREATVELSRANDLSQKQQQQIETLEADKVLSLWAIDQSRMYGTDSPSTYGSFYIDPNYPSRGPVFGTRNISDSERLFGSQREPVVSWYIVKMAVDMFDNWFKVVEEGKEDDDTLDNEVQKVLNKLNAKREYTRAFIFERRYGTSILLYSTTKTKEGEKWIDPIYEINEQGTRVYPANNRQVVRITAYPKPKFDVLQYETDEANIRLGEPKTYKVTRGGLVNHLEVHYSRVNKIATQLDEDPIWGVSRVDGIYDDATGYRNLRWGQYQLWWRVGTGFAHLTFPEATREEIKTWIRDGYFNDIFTRSFFVSGKGGETIDFKGVQGSFVNPAPFNETAKDNLSMGTGIPKNLLVGAQAGTISGSETNLTAYDKLISGEQELAESSVRDTIDLLMDLGQIKFNRNDKRYKIIWNPIFEQNPKEKATAELLQEQVYEKKLTYMTINEVRELKELPPIENGNVVPGLIYKLMQNPGGQSQSGPFPSGFNLSPFDGKDEVLKPSNNQAFQLEEELSQLLTRIKYDQTTYDDARNEALNIIEKYVELSRDAALKKLSDISGKQIVSLSVESQMIYDNLTAYYITYFEKQLTDVLSNRG